MWLCGAGIAKCDILYGMNFTESELLAGSIRLTASDMIVVVLVLPVSNNG